jgi:hypothetical protein
MAFSYFDKDLELYQLILVTLTAKFALIKLSILIGHNPFRHREIGKL